MRPHPMPEFGSFTLLLALALSVYTLVMGGIALWRSRGAVAGPDGAAARVGGRAVAEGDCEVCCIELRGGCAGVGLVHERLFGLLHSSSYEPGLEYCLQVFRA